MVSGWLPVPGGGGGLFIPPAWLAGRGSPVPVACSPWLPALHGSRALSMMAVLRVLPVVLPADMVGVALSPGVAPGWYVLPVAYSPRCGGCLLFRLTGQTLSLSRRVIPAPVSPLSWLTWWRVLSPAPGCNGRALIPGSDWLSACSRRSPGVWFPLPPDWRWLDCMAVLTLSPRLPRALSVVVGCSLD